MNATFASIYRRGFDVLAMAEWTSTSVRYKISRSIRSTRFVRETFLAHREAEAIYMLGPAWHTTGIVGMMEGDFDVPVVHATPALCWEIQKRLHVHEPVFGFGKLLAELL